MANCWRCLIKYSSTSTSYLMAKKDSSYTRHSPPIPTHLTRCGANTDGHKLPVLFISRVFVVFFWNWSSSHGHPFPIFSRSTFEAYEQMLQNVENSIREVCDSYVPVVPAPLPNWSSRGKCLCHTHHPKDCVCSLLCVPVPYRTRDRKSVV